MSRVAPPASPPGTHSYAIAGVGCTITAPAPVLERIDESYGPFRDVLPAGSKPLALRLSADESGLTLTDAEGFVERWPELDEALLGTLNRLVACVLDRLAGQGIYAIHAASLADGNGGVVIAGRSGTGKTTLALGLVGRGLRLLSDDFALSAPDARTILPYRRSLHLRPGTPELIPGLSFLAERPLRLLGGGSEWPLSPTELEEVFPGCLGEATSLRHVVLLDERVPDGPGTLEPVSPALASVELLRGTPAAVGAFDRVLTRMTMLLAEARCARLRPGTFAGSLDLLLEWLASDPGRARA